MALNFHEIAAREAMIKIVCDELTKAIAEQAKTGSDLFAQLEEGPDIYVFDGRLDLNDLATKVVDRMFAFPAA